MIGFSSRSEIHFLPYIYKNSIFSRCTEVKYDICGVIDIRTNMLPSSCTKFRYLYRKINVASKTTNKTGKKCNLQYCNRECSFLQF